MNRFLVVTAAVVMASSLVACSGQKEVKSPNQQGYAADAPSVVPKENWDEKATQTPPAPSQVEPSKEAPAIQVVVAGVTRPLAEGERFDVVENRMLFLYSPQARADCSNVSLTGAGKEPLAGLCQISVKPYEQHLAPSQTHAVAVTVTGDQGARTERHFQVFVLPLVD